MRLPAWCWACAVVLFVNCGDDGDGAKHPAGGGDAGEGFGTIGGSPGEDGGESSGGSGTPSAGQPASGGQDAAMSGAGGEGTEANLPLFQSGTRLRAIVQSAGDASWWIGWHDTELDSDCSFRKGEDDVMRCLPQSFITAYSDDTCETAIMHAAPGCAVPEFALANGPDCGDGASAYQVLDEVTPAKTYSLSGNNCQEATFGSLVFHATAPVPIGMFIAADEVLNRKSADLGLSYLQATDGALQPLMPSDLAREHACSPSGVGDYLDRCVPFGTAYVSANNRYYSDEDCMDLVAHLFCSESPPIAVTHLGIEALECSSQVVYSYSEVGAETTAASQSNGQQCAAPAPSGPRVYEIGESIPAESLPEVSSVDLGSGRVKARYASTKQGEPLTFATFYDSLLDFPCSAHPTIGSGLRCMPQAQYAYLYSDDACENLVVAMAPPTGQCPEQAPPEFALADDFPFDQCGGLQPSRVYKTGAKVTINDGLRTKTQQGCEGSGADPNGLIFYATTEVPAAELAEITLETE